MNWIVVASTAGFVLGMVVMILLHAAGIDPFDIDLEDDNRG